MDVLTWGGLAYVCLILAFVAYGVMRSLSSEEYRASVARAEREMDGFGLHPMCRCVVVEPGDEDDWLVPDVDMEPWGDLFSEEQRAALEALRHTPVAIERRRAMTVSETMQ